MTKRACKAERRELRLAPGPSRPFSVRWRSRVAALSWAERLVALDPQARTMRDELGEETTVHWHGLRVPYPLDGVPHLTQRPIAPGESFVYEFLGAPGRWDDGRDQGRVSTIQPMERPRCAC